MYELFLGNDFPVRGDIRVNEWEYARTKLLQGLDEIKSFYRKNVTTVKSNHILVSTINGLNIPYVVDMSHYYGMVRSRANNLATSLGMTSVFHKGKVYSDGYFFGTGTREVIIANNEAFDPVEAEKNWRELVPVKVLYHGMTQLVAPILDGTRTFQKEGYTVIMINIPLLAVQYQSWRKEINSKLKNPLNEGHFIRQYVLPNMCASYLDMAIVNRFAGLLDNKPKVPNINTHTFFISDVSGKVDMALELFKDAITDKKMTYYHMMDVLPAVSVPTMRESLVLPKVAQVRGIEWAMVLSRITVVSLLVRLNDLSNSKANTGDNGYIRMSIKKLKSDGDFNSAFSRYHENLMWLYINTKIVAYL